MNLRRLGILQWVGLLAGALVWISQHVVGYGMTLAECNAGGRHFGIDNDVWQAALLGAAAALVVGAQVCATAVFLRTRGANFGDGPSDEGRWRGALPYTRLHFFGAAAMAANAIFLVIIVLDGIATIVDPTCRQS
jgi:hypothetical protein